MEVRGQVRTPSAPERVEAVLSDVRRLAACVPGCVGVASVEGDRFVADMVLDLPFWNVPVRVDGALQRGERALRVDLRGRPRTVGGGLQAAVDLAWQPGAADGPAAGGTRLDYRMQVRLRGRLALVGEAVMRSTSDAKARAFERRLLATLADAGT